MTEEISPYKVWVAARMLPSPEVGGPATMWRQKVSINTGTGARDPRKGSMSPKGHGPQEGAATDGVEVDAEREA